MHKRNTSRGSGSVESGTGIRSTSNRFARCKSFVSTENSTPEKEDDTEMTLWREMHRNLIACD